MNAAVADATAENKLKNNKKQYSLECCFLLEKALPIQKKRF